MPFDATSLGEMKFRVTDQSTIIRYIQKVCFCVLGGNQSGHGAFCASANGVLIELMVDARLL